MPAAVEGSDPLPDPEGPQLAPGQGWALQVLQPSPTRDLGAMCPIGPCCAQGGGQGVLPAGSPDAWVLLQLYPRWADPMQPWAALGLSFPVGQQCR